MLFNNQHKEIILRKKLLTINHTLMNNSNLFDSISKLKNYEITIKQELEESSIIIEENVITLDDNYNIILKIYTIKDRYTMLVYVNRLIHYIVYFTNDFKLVTLKDIENKTEKYEFIFEPLINDLYSSIIEYV